MDSLITQCEASYPHPDWARLKALPYADLSALAKWIEVPFRNEPHHLPLKGLWFGLFNPYSDGLPVSDIYVCGSERFIPDPDDNSWAVRPDWWPQGRYANSKVLADIYHIAYCQKSKTHDSRTVLGNNAEYPLVLGYGAFAVQELLSKIDPAVVLAKSESLGVAVGYDSGDFVLIGCLSQKGIGVISSC